MFAPCVWSDASAGPGADRGEADLTMRVCHLDFWGHDAAEAERDSLLSEAPAPTFFAEQKLW